VTSHNARLCSGGVSSEFGTQSPSDPQLPNPSTLGVNASTPRANRSTQGANPSTLGASLSTLGANPSTLRALCKGLKHGVKHRTAPRVLGKAQGPVLMRFGSLPSHNTSMRASSQVKAVGPSGGGSKPATETKADQSGVLPPDVPPPLQPIPPYSASVLDCSNSTFQ